MHRFYSSDIHKTKRNIGLVGRHDDQKSGRAEGSDGVPNTGQQTKILQLPGRVCLAVSYRRGRQDAIAIKKYGLSHLALGATQVAPHLPVLMDAGDAARTVPPSS